MSAFHNTTDSTGEAQRNRKVAGTEKSMMRMIVHMRGAGKGVQKESCFLVDGWVEWGDSCTIDAFIWVNA